MHHGSHSAQKPAKFQKQIPRFWGGQSSNKQKHFWLLPANMRNKQMCFILGWLLSNWPWPQQSRGEMGDGLKSPTEVKGRAWLPKGHDPSLETFLPQSILSEKEQIQEILQIKALIFSFPVFLKKVLPGKQLRQETWPGYNHQGFGAYCPSLPSDPCQIHTSPNNQERSKS